LRRALSERDKACSRDMLERHGCFYRLEIGLTYEHFGVADDQLLRTQDFAGAAMDETDHSVAAQAFLRVPRTAFEKEQNAFLRVLHNGTSGHARVCV